jgi:hypothetical protein
MFHLECRNYGIALQPENVNQFNRLIGGVIKLPGKLPSQISNVLKIDSIVIAVAVVPGNPHIQAQVRAQLEQ